jgi:hypothetical protein
MLYVQVGLLPHVNHFFEFKEVIDGALEKLGGILRREEIETMVLSVPLDSGNSTRDFATLLNHLNSGESSLEAFTLVPRKLRQYTGTPTGVNVERPLVVVIETDTSLRLTKALLLHEFGHARKDYPTLWELLETTTYRQFIIQVDVEQSLRGWNPFSNFNNEDPFREFVAQEFARRYLAQDAAEFEMSQLASLRSKAEEGQHHDNYFLRLYLQIRAELSGNTFPEVDLDSVSSAIADSIRMINFREYVRLTISEMLSNASSPLEPLRDRTEQVLEEIDKALSGYGL